MRRLSLALAAVATLLTAAAGTARATEYHVAVTGNDAQPGTEDKPFATVQKAANVLQPGDTCTVHAGTYREWVKPKRGGTSEHARITYRGKPGDAVYVTGAERVTSWHKEGALWKAVLPNTTFGGFNPYASVIKGEYLTYGGDHHVGTVFFSGEAYKEKLTETDVMNAPKSWRAVVDGKNTTLWGNFGKNDPNQGLTEITVRPHVFAPTTVGLDYITVEGFHLVQAATNWAPPTAKPQEGLLMTNMGLHWLIQNNELADSRAVCLASGIGTEDHSWDIDKVGGHVIRNNWIRRCGEAGIAGSQGLPVSVIEKNLIEDINPLGDFGGYEGAGIKIHSAVDVIIRNNVIRKVRSFQSGVFGIWLDFEAQGTRVTGNVFYDIDSDPMNLEQNHGPTLLDDNVFIGREPYTINDNSSNTIHVHNLFVRTSSRLTPGDARAPNWWFPHTTKIAGAAPAAGVDTKYLNNVFVGVGLGTPKGSGIVSDYNVFYAGARPTTWGDEHSKTSAFDPTPAVLSLPNGVRVSWTTDRAPRDVRAPLVTRDLVGVSALTHQGLEHHDGSPLTVDTDLLGAPRSKKRPVAGPIEFPDGTSVITFTVLAGPNPPLATSAAAKSR